MAQEKVASLMFCTTRVLAYLMSSTQLCSRCPRKALHWEGSGSQRKA